jgi:hypothetical protein
MTSQDETPAGSLADNRLSGGLSGPANVTTKSIATSTPNNPTPNNPTPNNPTANKSTTSSLAKLVQGFAQGLLEQLRIVLNYDKETGNCVGMTNLERKYSKCYYFHISMSNI